MGTNSQIYDTYPRFNFRTGPRGTQKRLAMLKNGRGQNRKILMSADSEIVPYSGICTWMLNIIPAPPAQMSTEANTPALGKSMSTTGDDGENHEDLQLSGISEITRVAHENQQLHTAGENDVIKFV